MTPLFTAVIPIYNVERFLDKCIQSIITQSYKNIEIILVDDGSPDHCPQICDEYARKDSRIKVIHKPNGGLVSARQAGTAEATGEYIACVDGDDWISETYFERFAEIVEMKRPDIICCGAIWSSEAEETMHPYSMQTGLYTRKDIENKIFPMLIERKDGTYFSPSIWAKAFKKEIYKPQQLAINPAIRIGEDHACVKPCIYRARSLYIMGECLYYYRQNPTAMTKSKRPFEWDGPKLIGQHFEKQINMNEHDFQTQVYRNVVHNLFNVAASQFNRKIPYKNVVSDISLYLDDEYYKNAIQNCRYSYLSKGRFALRVLHNKRYILMYIYNRHNRW